MLRNLTIKSRLIFVISMLSLLLAVIGVLGLHGMNIANEGLRTVYQDRLIAAVRLSEVNFLQAENQRQLHLMLMHDPRLPESRLHDHPLTFHSEKMAENTRKNNISWDGFTATAQSAEGKKLAEEFIAKRKLYQVTRNKAIELIKAGNFLEANSVVVKETGPAYMANTLGMQALLALQVESSRIEYEHALASNATTRNIAISAIVLGILLAALIGVLLIRNIGRSLAQAMRVAAHIASGDLGSQIEVRGNDEISHLLTSMQTMQTALKHIVSEVQRLVAAANKGDFSVKIETASLQGFARDIARELNQLSATVDGVFLDTIKVSQALAEGDLSLKITQDYSGVYHQVKVSVNTTTEALIRIVNEIQTIVEAAATRGDFSVKMELTGKQGYTKTLSELLNRLSEVTDGGLRDIMRVSKALAAGDLTQTVIRDYPGLFGQTRDGINTTVENLKMLVDQIKLAVQNINTGAGEIAEGNRDLSQRTELLAANLDESSSSMNELTATVRDNAQNAMQGNKLAIDANNVACKGGAAVGQVVGTMCSIYESSRKIVDITSVIDSIAFQTNILALNAAVEAARAGEQGRGFAVVAGEVRTLAHRSAAAAKEIKLLISDSVGKVENGIVLVEQAGQTMGEIVSSIKRVTDIMAEISQASNEQSTGIEQVNKAIAQMDDVTQQNAALVQQAASVADSLEDQAKNLTLSVSQFKLQV